MWRHQKQAEAGDTVQVHYTGKLNDGTVCLESAGRSPIEFTLGQQRLIAGVEEAVVGMRMGETRMITVAPQDAFGEHSEGMLIVVDRKRVQTHMDPEIGQKVWAACASGRKMPVTITAVSRTKVTLDTNHPLAGKTITFEIHLVRIC